MADLLITRPVEKVSMQNGRRVHLTLRQKNHLDYIIDSRGKRPCHQDNQPCFGQGMQPEIPDYGKDGPGKQQTPGCNQQGVVPIKLTAIFCAGKHNSIQPQRIPNHNQQCLLMLNGLWQRYLADYKRHQQYREPKNHWYSRRKEPVSAHIYTDYRQHNQQPYHVPQDDGKRLSVFQWAWQRHLPDDGWH